MAKLIRRYFKICGVTYQRVNDVAFLCFFDRLVIYKVGANIGWGKVKKQ